MGIMKFVCKLVEEKRPSFYLFVIFIMEITSFLIVDTAFPNQAPPRGEDLMWRILWVGPLMLIIYIWLYYAPIVCKDLERLEKAFPDKAYHDLYLSFLRWLNQKPSQAGSAKEKWFKWTYAVLWSLFILAFTYFVANCFCCENHLLTELNTALYICLTTITITLNFSSYYICMMFVYFLMRLYRVGCQPGFEYVKELPSVTHGFQVLLNTANTIYLYFLMDSFLSTVAFFTLWKLAPKKVLRENSTRCTSARTFYI